jgi:hypothetical protein
MSPEALVLALVWTDSLHSVLALAIGFAVAGLLASGYQLLTLQQPSFHLLNEGQRAKAIMAVLFLLFTAPIIIISNVLRGPRLDRRNLGFAAMAALLAGFWSLMSGTVVVMALEALQH